MKRLEFFGLMVVLAAATFLRFWNLEVNPLVYADEGVNLKIAWTAATGQAAFGNIKYLWMPHAPLAYYLSGGLMEIIGVGIFQFRFFAALCGVVTCAVTYFLGKELFSKEAGLMAGFIYASTPFVVRITRFGFIDYHLGAVFIVASIVFLVRYLKSGQRKDLIFAGCIAAAGLASSYYVLFFTIAAAVAILLYDKNVKRTALFVGLTVTPASLTVLMLVFQDWSVFSIIAFGSINRVTTIIFMPAGWLMFFKQNLWSAGVVGCVVAGLFGKWRGGFSIIFLIFFTFIIASTTIYYSAVYPFLAIGFGAVAWYVGRYLWTQCKPVLALPKFNFRLTVEAVLSICLIGVLVFQVGYPMYETYGMAMNEFPIPPAERLFYTDMEEANRLADWVNSHTSPDDIVIGAAPYTWLFHAKTSDWILAAGWEGNPTFRPMIRHNDSDVLFSGDYRDAKYLITHRLLHDYVLAAPEFQAFRVRDIIDDVEANWKPVYTQGEYVVYLNPRFKM